MLPEVESVMTWRCTPCGEDHTFGDICWYWDVDPDDPRSILYDSELDDEKDQAA